MTRLAHCPTFITLHVPFFSPPRFSPPRFSPPRFSLTRCAAEPLTPKQRAYIFQPSPYNHLRARQLTQTAAPSPPPITSDSFESLITQIESITDDPLAEFGGNIVIHRGSPSARLMIIGEAPGAEEDRLLKPFVGDAGQLLDKIFRYAGFDLQQQVYVTNIAKRRPPNNRNPTDEEIAYWIPYLKQEIRLIKPCIIVPAGAVAARALLETQERISDLRGVWQRGEAEADGAWIMPIFHPSYLLRNPKKKKDMLLDIHEIRAKFIELVPEQTLNPLTSQQ